MDRKDIDDDLKVEMMLEPWGDGFEPLSLSLYYYHAGRKSVDRKDIDDDLKVEMMLEPWGDGFEPLSLSHCTTMLGGLCGECKVNLNLKGQKSWKKRLQVNFFYKKKCELGPWKELCSWGEEGPHCNSHKIPYPH